MAYLALKWVKEPGNIFIINTRVLNRFCANDDSNYFHGVVVVVDITVASWESNQKSSLTELLI